MNLSEERWLARLLGGFGHRVIAMEAEGYQNADPSRRDGVVLMDQAAEEIAPLDFRHDLHRVDVAQPLRHTWFDPTVGTLGVVMAGVAREDAVQVAASEDQGPVQHLVAKRPLGHGSPQHIRPPYSRESVKGSLRPFGFVEVAERLLEELDGCEEPQGHRDRLIARRFDEPILPLDYVNQQHCLLVG